MTLVSTRYLPQDTERFEFANGIAHVHAEHVCDPGFPCVIHRHSEHEGADQPLFLTERGLVGHLGVNAEFRACPDSVAYFERNYPPEIQHGIRCDQCSDEIYSNSRHDFVSCTCGAIFIDGGFDYVRIGTDGGGDFAHVSREVVRHALPYYYREEAAA